ncbi:MAG: hypothetical protein AAFO89_04840 [Planctomycetota bacterium]
MASNLQTHAPPEVLRRVRASRAVLVRAAISTSLVRSLPFAGAAALVAAVGWYLFGSPLGSLPAWAPPAIVAAAFVALAAAFVIRRSRRLPSMLTAAVELDQSAKTHSALASSLEFSTIQPGPFEKWALVNAATEASRSDLRMPKPNRGGRVLRNVGIGGAQLLVAISIASLVPPRSWASLVGATAGLDADPERIAEVQETIENARVEVVEAANDLGIEADNEFFDTLEAELESGMRDPDEVVASAAEQLDKLAEQAETEADRAERARDEAAERLAELAPEDFTAARNLAESLAAGDFNQAAQDADALQSQLDDGATRDDLRRLADQLDRAADSNPQQDDPATADAADPGESETDALDEQLRELADELRERANDEPRREASPPGEQLAEQPEPPTAEESETSPESEPSPPLDQRMEDQRPEQPQDARQPERDEQQDGIPPSGEGEQSPDGQPQSDPQQQKQPQDDRSPEERNDEQSNQNQQQQPGDQQEQERQPGEQPRQQQQQDSRPGDQTPDQPTPDEQTQQQPTNERPAEDQPTPDQPGSPMPDQPTETSQPPEPDANAPERSAQPNPDEQPPGDGAPDPDSPGQPTPGEPQAPSGDGPTAPTPGDQAPDQPAREPGNQAPDRPGGPSQDPSAEPSTLERLAQEQRRADDLRQFADQLRDRADQMLEDESADERSPAAMQSPQPADAEEAPADPWSAPTELIDARDRDADPETRERVISEWFKDPEGRPLDAAAPSDARETIRRAARDAERAVEQQTVPRRYEDLVRRVFERYARRAEAPTDATDASDAD